MSRIATDVSALVRSGALERNARRAEASALATLERSLEDARRTLAALADTAAIGADARARAQASLDGAAANVRTIADAPNSRAAREAGAPSLPGADGTTPPQTAYVVRKFTTGIVSATAFGNVSSFPPSQTEVEFRVTEAAQTAALRLSFGSDIINLERPENRFQVIVAGERGSERLLFTSGTTLTAVVGTINHFTTSTGVSATLSGTGIRLSSQSYGGAEFVSVRVVDHGGQAGAVLTYGDTQPYASGPGVQGSSATSFANAGLGVIDYGADLQGTINGERAQSNGLTLGGQVWLANPPQYIGVSVAVTLSLQAATTVGYRGVALLEGVPWAPAVERDAVAGAPPGAVRAPFETLA